MNTELYSRFEVIPVSLNKSSHPCSSACDPDERIFASSCSPSFECFSLNVVVNPFDVFCLPGRP